MWGYNSVLHHGKLFLGMWKVEAQIRLIRAFTVRLQNHSDQVSVRYNNVKQRSLFDHVTSPTDLDHYIGLETGKSQTK